MKTKSKIVVSSVLYAVIAILLVALIIGNTYAVRYSAIITTHLNQRTDKVVDVDPNETVEDVFKSEFSSARALLRTQKQYAETIQSEGSVLLINKNNTLPMSAMKNITLLGTTSVDFQYGGAGAGSISTLGVPTLKQAFENYEINVNPTVWDLYSSGEGANYRRSTGRGSYTVGEAPVSIFTDSIKSSFSSYGDAAIVVIGRTGLEGSDLSLSTTENSSKHSLQLSDNEIDLIKLAKQSFDKVIVLLNTLNAMELNELQELDVDACLWVGAGGQYGINAIPKMMKGDLAPSGRLVDTYAVDALVSPAMQNFGGNAWGSGKDAVPYVFYAEGIYVGYKYYETRYEDYVLGQGNAGEFDYKKQVQFPFGYGLSYTSFQYSDYKMTETADKFEFSVKVTNNGARAGKDVVEIYMQSPYTEYDKTNKVEKASVELVGFAKTSEIAPTKSQTVTVSVEKSSLAAYDYTKAKTYIVDNGTYYFALGTDAHDALNNILATKGKTTADGMDYNGNESFVKQYEQNKFDDKTYATSLSGGSVTNQLDNANLSYYDSTVTYLTRNDWAGTFPTTYAGELTDKIKADVAAPQIKENTSDYTMPTTEATSEEYGRISLVNLTGRAYDDPLWNVLLNQMSASEMYNLVRVGGYQTQLVESISKPSTIDKDGPAGISSTLVGGKGAFGYPVECVISSTWNLEIAQRIGELVGEDGLYTATSGWYAPSMNIHRTPFAGRNFEYYSEDGFISGMFGAATVKGCESKGLYAYVKHFAFNDQETNRSSISTFTNEQAAREIYLKPFQITVEKGRCHGIMAAMNRIGTTWVGHSKPLMTNILRGEWDFQGMVITDQASFYSATIADLKPTLYAGVDMMLCTNNTLWEIDGYASSAMWMTYLRNASKNILYAVANSNAVNGLKASTRIVEVLAPWQIWLIIGDVVVGVGAAVGVTFITISLVKALKKKSDETVNA